MAYAAARLSAELLLARDDATQGKSPMVVGFRALG